MEIKGYVKKSISTTHVVQANKMGLSVNEYLNHLVELVRAEKTTETANQLERLTAVEGIATSMTEALKHQRYLTDSQSKKIDEQSKMISQQIEITTKIINAFSSKLAFIEALEKEITA